MNAAEQRLVDAFHALYYEGPAGSDHTFRHTRWMGVPCMKCPLDLWIYQEILFELQPDLIVETGTFAGGSALYLAHLCDLLGHGRVVSIDVERGDFPVHPRIDYVTGSSTDPAVVARVAEMARAAQTVMVILDSDHSAAHVHAELDAYSPMVTPGSYLVVEDTNVNGHPVSPRFGDGPFEAVQRFVAAHGEFRADRHREKFMMTFNPGGFLRRLRPGEPAADAGAGDAGTMGATATTPAPQPPARSRDAALLEFQATRLLGASRVRPADAAAPGEDFEASLRSVLDDASRLLAERDDEIETLRGRLDEVSKGLRQAVEQLEAARKANEGFAVAVAQLEVAQEASAGFAFAVAQLEQRDAEVAELRAALAECRQQAAASPPAPPGNT